MNAAWAHGMGQEFTKTQVFAKHGFNSKGKLKMSKICAYMIAPAILAMALATAGTASATIITFEGQSNTIYNNPIVRGGFLIGNVASDEQHFHEIDSTQYGLTSNGTGVLLNDRNTRIFVADQLGGVFTLGSVDVATAASNNPGLSILVEGFLNGLSVGTLSTTFGSAFTTLSGSSLGTVDRLVFDGIGSGGGFELDNLTLNAASGPGSIPEPVSLALFGIGLAGLAAARKRQAV